MASYAVEIKRCGHIKASRAQCGSPALKDKEFCYYHQQNRTVPAEIYLDGETYCDGQIMLPPLEDAHAIQMVVRHVIQLMLQRRINRKDAGLMLYALQIASGNLKQMEAEKPRPVQVVREPEKVGETPMGMTPWSASGEGHDVEEDEGEEFVDYEEGEDAEPQQHRPSQANPAPPPTAEELYAMTAEERKAIRKEWHEVGEISAKEWKDFLWHDGPDPMLLAIRRQCARKERRRREAGRREQAEICYRCRRGCADQVELEETEESGEKAEGGEVSDRGESSERVQVTEGAGTSAASGGW